MRDDHPARITLDIDEDVLDRARELAARRGITAGRVISDLVRSALAPRDYGQRKRNGVPVLSTRKRVGLVTPEIVNRSGTRDKRDLIAIPLFRVIPKFRRDPGSFVPNSRPPDRRHRLKPVPLKNIRPLVLA